MLPKTVNMTAGTFRKMALEYPRVAESSHMGHSDFRVDGKIFATLDFPDENWGMVKLTPEQQLSFIKKEPGVFKPCSGTWGQHGSTNVQLAPLKRRVLKPALDAAWGNVASEAKKRPVRQRKRPSQKDHHAPRDVDEYLAGVPEPARGFLKKMRAAIRSRVPPEASEIISYRIPAFRHKRGMVWYGAFSNHCSLFPAASVIELFKNELKGFATSKGTIHFALDKPLPIRLIQNLVKARFKQSGTKRGA